MKPVLNGTWAQRKTEFSGKIFLTTRIQISGTCINRILSATEKFRSLAVPFQAGFTV